MTMQTAVTVTITLTMALVILPKMYLASLQAEWLFSDENKKMLRALLAQRNDWILRHLACAIGAVALIWTVTNIPTLNPPKLAAPALGVYACCSLLFAALESLLAQKIALMLMIMPSKVRAGD